MGFRCRSVGQDRTEKQDGDLLPQFKSYPELRLVAEVKPMTDEFLSISQKTKKVKIFAVGVECS